jgi:hypothetical protein
VQACSVDQQEPAPRPPATRLKNQSNRKPSDLDRPLDGKSLLLCGVTDSIIKRLTNTAPVPKSIPEPVGPAAASNPTASSSNPTATAPANAAAAAPANAAANAAAPTTVVTDKCDPNTPPGPVRNLKVASNAAAGDGKAAITITWDGPGGAECVTSYEVDVINTQTASSSKSEIPGGATNGLQFKYRGDANTAVGATGCLLFGGWVGTSAAAVCLPSRSAKTAPLQPTHTYCTPKPPPQFLFDVIAINDAGTGSSRSVSVKSASNRRR